MRCIAVLAAVLGLCSCRHEIRKAERELSVGDLRADGPSLDATADAPFVKEGSARDGKNLDMSKPPDKKSSTEKQLTPDAAKDSKPTPCTGPTCRVGTCCDTAQKFCVVSCTAGTCFNGNCCMTCVALNSACVPTINDSQCGKGGGTCEDCLNLKKTCVGGVCQ